MSRSSIPFILPARTPLGTRVSSAAFHYANDPPASGRRGALHRSGQPPLAHTTAEPFAPGNGELGQRGERRGAVEIVAVSHRARGAGDAPVRVRALKQCYGVARGDVALAQHA